MKFFRNFVTKCNSVFLQETETCKNADAIGFKELLLTFPCCCEVNVNLPEIAKHQRGSETFV